MIALTLVYTAYVTEVYRAGIESVHPSQRMAARSLGLSYCAVDALRRRSRRRCGGSIPPLLNDFIGLQKDTALVSVIGVAEAALQAQAYSQTYANFTSYTVAAVFFVLLTIPLARFTDHLIAARERRERARRRRELRRDRERLEVRSATLQVLDARRRSTSSEHNVVCLIGASGSGKSTLLRCINLLERVDEGDDRRRRRRRSRTATST